MFENNSVLAYVLIRGWLLNKTHRTSVIIAICVCMLYYLSKVCQYSADLTFLSTSFQLNHYLFSPTILITDMLKSVPCIPCIDKSSSSVFWESTVYSSTGTLVSSLHFIFRLYSYKCSTQSRLLFGPLVIQMWYLICVRMLFPFSLLVWDIFPEYIKWWEPVYHIQPCQSHLQCLVKHCNSILSYHFQGLSGQRNQRCV